MQYFDITTLRLMNMTLGKAAPCVEAWVSAPEARGKLLGAFTSEHGRLNELVILRGFDMLEEMMGERERAQWSSNPFSCATHLNGYESSAYKPFAFSPPVEVGTFGPFYELRTYFTKVDGLKPTAETWARATPKRIEYSRLSVVMYALDGPPRITHLWPFESLELRLAIRKKTVADGIWPPEGAPALLDPDRMYSSVLLSLPFSPLQ